MEIDRKSATNSPLVYELKILIQNKHGENLVGILHKINSENLVILCHGFRASKEDNILVGIANELTKQGINAFRFDFAGNGESEGVFQYGHYNRECDDLRAVVSYFSNQKYNIIALIGHSKGGNAVLLYASKYTDVNKIINISGRFGLEKGIAGRLGKDFMQKITQDNFIDVKDKSGNFEYRVTLNSLTDRLNTDMHSASLSISKYCRVLTIHGSKDEIVPVRDAYKFAKLVPNHKLQVIEGANHRFTSHLEELISIVLLFIQDDHKERLVPKL